MNELLGRAYLENAIGKAQTRNARRSAAELKQRAERARDDAAEFIAENPFTAVAGGLVVGLLIGSLLPRFELGKSAKSLATKAGTAGLAYGREAWNAAIKAHRDEKTMTDDHNEG